MSLLLLLKNPPLYTRGSIISLPSDDVGLDVGYSSQDFLDVASDDGVRVGVTSSSGYSVHQFKVQGANNTSPITVNLNLQTNQAATSSNPVVLEIYNRTSGLWEMLGTDTTASANTDFNISGVKTTGLSNYYDANFTVSVRVYQLTLLSPAVFDSATSASQFGSNAQFTFSHTVGSGSNRLLLVGLHGGDVSGSVTYGGLALTEYATTINTDSLANVRTRLFYMVAPATGANNVVVSISGPPTDLVFTAISFSGVNQSTPLGTAVAGGNNNTTSHSLAVSPSSADLWAGFISILNNATSFTGGAGVTSRASATGAVSGAVGTAPDTNTSFAWTTGTAGWSSQIVVPVKPA